MDEVIELLVHGDECSHVDDEMERSGFEIVF